MRRRTLLVAFGVFAACGEPYEGEIPSSPAPDRDAGGTEASIDAAGDEDAGADAGPLDAGPDVDPCDRDRDGFREKSLACGGDDCDDDDDRAHPDAGFVRATPTPKTNGDWNCDNVTTREVSANVNCAGLLGTTGCNLQGFTTDPPCGADATYVVCKVNGLSCAADPAQTKTQKQGCK